MVQNIFCDTVNINEKVKRLRSFHWEYGRSSLAGSKQRAKYFLLGKARQMNSVYRRYNIETYKNIDPTLTTTSLQSLVSTT